MAAELAAALRRLGYAEPLPRGALGIQRGDCLTAAERQEYAALEAAGAVRGGAALEEAVAAAQQRLEALRGGGDRLAAEVAELEEQLAAQRGCTAQSEARLQALQGALAEVQRDAERLGTATGAAAAAHCGPAREGAVVAGRRLEQAFKALCDVAHRLLDAQTPQRTTTAAASPAGSLPAQQAFACLNSSRALAGYHTEVLDAVEAGLRRLSDELAGQGRTVEDEGLAHLKLGWAVSEWQRLQAEAQLKQATAVHQCLSQLTAAKDLPGSEEWQTKQAHQEEAELADAREQLRQLALAVGPLAVECQVAGGEGSAKAALLEHCLAGLDAMHQAVRTLQAVEEEGSQQAEREERHVADCEAAMVQLAACLATDRSQHQQRASVYAHLDTPHRGGQLQPIEDALKAAAADVPHPPQSLAEALAQTLESQRSDAAQAAAQRGAASLEEAVAALAALRQQPQREEALAGLQALQAQVQEMTSGVSDIRDYQSQHQTARSSEERQLWPLLFTNTPRFLDTLKDLGLVAEAQGSLAHYL